jgi:hypothetical protein
MRTKIKCKEIYAAPEEWYDSLSSFLTGEQELEDTYAEANYFERGFGRWEKFAAFAEAKAPSFKPTLVDDRGMSTTLHA